MLLLAPGELHADAMMCMLVASACQTPDIDDVMSITLYNDGDGVQFTHHRVEAFEDVGYASIAAPSAAP